MEEHINEQLPEKPQNNNNKDMEENLDGKLESKEPDNIQPQSYYDTKGRKGPDILLGFFGGIVFLIIMAVINSAIISASKTAEIAYGFIAFSILIYIVALVIFMVKERKYIAIGLILLIIVPLIIFGGCLLVIS